MYVSCSASLPCFTCDLAKTAAVRLNLDIRAVCGKLFAGRLRSHQVVRGHAWPHLRQIVERIRSSWKERLDRRRWPVLHLLGQLAAQRRNRPRQQHADTAAMPQSLRNGFCLTGLTGLTLPKPA